MTIIQKSKWVALGVIAILFLILATQNTGATSVRFMGWEMEVPRMILSSGVGLAGFVAGILTVLLIQRHRYRNSPESEESSQPGSLEER